MNRMDLNKCGKSTTETKVASGEQKTIWHVLGTVRNGPNYSRKHNLMCGERSFIKV